jgi:hypothetical protein
VVRRYTIRPLTVCPLAKRSLSRLLTSVDSALLGRKLDVSSVVSSDSLLPSGPNAKISRSHMPGTTHLVRRPETNAARDRIVKTGILGR